MRERPTLAPPRTVPVGQARRTQEAVRMFRANFVFGALLLMLALLLGRFAQLQLVQGAEFRARADARHATTLKLVGLRGRVWDRHGRLLASSAFGREVAVDPDPQVIAEKDLPGFCARLAAILDDDIPASELLRTVEAARYKWVVLDGPLGLRWRRIGARHLVLRGYVSEPRVVAALDEASMGKDALRGLKVRCVERRAYPNGDYASHAIGRPVPEGGRLELGEGVEGCMDARLEPAKLSAVLCRDGGARCMADGARFDRDLLAGRDVHLTLDIVVQHHVERALDALVERWKPTQAVAIVLDPRTGHVLALANRATHRDTGAPSACRNLAIEGVYEPGSVFKPFTVAWALRHGLPPETTVPMPLTALFAGDKNPISDSHFVGDGDVVHLLAHSSNTGAAWLTEWMGPDGLPNLLDWVEVRAPTGVEMLHEIAWQGPRKFDSVGSRLRAGFGHSFGITPLRLASAFTALARADGRAARPTLLMDALSPVASGEPLASAEHLAIVRRGLAGCVDEGTARVAFEGCAYAAAGKTGTALIDAKRRHVCTFAGFAPRHDPRLVVLVMAVTRRDQNGSGGQVSAPAVRRILERSLAYLKVAPEAEQGAGPVLAHGAGGGE